nr:hypothetical protein [Tanacetum cinerariifolium]
MSRKKHVTFKEPPKPSPRVTKKRVTPQVKKANVAVHLSTEIKSATGASKTAFKNHAWIYRKILDRMKEPLELSLSISSSSNVTMLYRFANCQLSDRKAGSKGISAIFE